MTHTGIVRNLDQLGRVVLPKELRRTMDIKDGDPIEILTDGDMICLKKYTPGCRLCGGKEQLIEVDGVKICHDCAVKVIDKYMED